ncbi:bifunctional tRNA pseudouridine(32) synthase/23S rRNA pseudouridine(746) synthase RluA [Rheinheimera sp. MMS21-TC3]|uniref:bifunctional tRNA pseudouridine(32) synthase/23S rRNA pseudouridine(746) synthase RluA n=1 Tax=Rheinheimera sp. MMS21-TC3 TaxID=3072790 RepID=UPI0028C38EB5|nr:bifunctional tRNA pseudouridine(32) synthase/23S rRNA pseudouridine(746) synthase RluA [Rheinheimera sp. MMS21-TC3]WNO62135.1 bifunctional tRNA pseudouridine(32) synthase/23S rRNA pseudouridine(746) synthase RluA [Rheinheimera sp. MMS21-TC3]
MSFIYSPPTQPYLDIIYQDQQLVVFNKPSGLLTVPGKAIEHKDSLEYRARLVWPEIRLVHRLDMSTSGIVIMALTADSQRQLNWQFQLRQTKKHYIANVWGHLTAKTGTIDLPLVCDWPNRPKQKVCYEHGKPSLTHYQVITQDKDSSRIMLTPVTGRSHQLRVHMQWLGHPILGDKFYAHSEAFVKTNRLQLHAESLTISHPELKNEIQFNCPCPF